MKSGTGQDLIRFWDWVVEKGLVKKATANSRKAAVVEVLDVLEDGESADIRQLDVEDTLRRFENLKSAKFTPGSLSTYKSRFRSSVSEYLRYLDNPSGWRPDIKPRKTAGSSVGPREPSQAKKPPASDSKDPNGPGTQSGGTARLIDYPFPVRPGLVAVLKLPMNLTASEARRLSSFLSALAMPDEEQETDEAHF